MTDRTANNWLTL